MYSLMEILFPERPTIVQTAKACLFRTPVSGTAPKDGPVVCVRGEGGASPVSMVAGRDLVSVAVSEHRQSLSLFPDGRMLVRAEDTVFQAAPGREGAQLISAGTSVTIGRDGDVIVVGDGFTVVVDALGRVFQPDAIDPASDGAGPAAGGGAVAANVLRFPAGRSSPNG